MVFRPRLKVLSDLRCALTDGSMTSTDGSDAQAGPSRIKETCVFGDGSVDIPEDLCEKESLFNDVLSMETWDKVLTAEQRAHLTKFLPTFPENDAREKQNTIKTLLTGENVRFGNPVQQFHKRLKDGFYSPGIARMASLMRKATYREYRYQQQRYFYKMLQNILISRKKLLEAASKLPPDQPIKMERLQPHAKNSSIEQRTKKRYFRELQEVREEVVEFETSSEDENYPEGQPPKMTKKQRKQLFHLEAALSPDMARVTSTMAPKPSDVENGNLNSVRSLSPFEITEEHYREMLLNHKRRRMEGEEHPELDTGPITFQDVVMRTSMTKRATPRPVSAAELSTKKKVKDKDKIEKKKKKTKGVVPSPPCVEELVKVKTEAVEPDEVANVVVKVEPPEMDYVDDGPEFFASSVSPTLIQDTFLSFFSLVRDIICKGPEQRIQAHKLEEEIRAWQEGPFAGLNEWYTQQMHWPDQVMSALKFLAGDLPGMHLDNFVPYLDYKDKIQMWQWIGVGRDSDENMAALCRNWLENKDDMPLAESLDSTPGSPPPPRIHTEWIVRSTTEDERAVYREQERGRYANPHKAFTFHMHEYESVVGPVKGVYGRDSGTNKAREHSLLVSDRPPFVTILSLVRDAAARLPNGEGTRADICELLKDSQYLAPASDSQVTFPIHTVVSGALDRLHYERDPCVKYDVNRKLWIYLHRNRTEEEFERIHQAYAVAAKAKKTVTKSKIIRVKSKDGTRPASAQSPGASDSLNLDAVGGTTTVASALSPVSAHSPRGSTSPRAQTTTAITSNKTSPKSSVPPTKVSRPPQASPKAAVNANPNTPHPSAKGAAVHSSQLTNAALSSVVMQTSARTPSVDTITQISSVSPAPFMLPQPHSSSRPSSTGSAQSLPSPKSVIANVNATQFVSVSQVQLAPTTISPKPIATPSTPTSQPKTVSNLLSQQQALQQIVAKQQAAAVLSATQVLTNKPTAIASSSGGFTPTVSAVKLLPSTVTRSDLILSKSIGSPILSPQIGQPQLQGLPTIMIKQEPTGHVIGTPATVAVCGKNTLPPSSKPVVARIITSPQVVSVGNLIASTLAATQKQGKTLQGPTTIKIQSGNLVRPMGGKPGHMNLIQTTAGGGLPRLAVVSQGGTGNLIPVSCATLNSQPKLVATASGQLGIMASQLAAAQSQLGAGNKPTFLTTQGGVKILSTGHQGVSLAQLSGKPGQTMVVTTKHTTPTSVAVSLAATTTSGQNVVFSGGVQTPTVVIASQGALKPAQTVVMTAAGTPQTVVMTAQQGMRPIAAVTPLTMKALQGVKVIPVSQASGSKGKTQPVFARIITPPTGLTLRPAGTLAATQQGISMIQSMAALPSGATALRQSTTTIPSTTACPTAIIRLQAPPFPTELTKDK